MKSTKKKLSRKIYSEAIMGTRFNIILVLIILLFIILIIRLFWIQVIQTESFTAKLEQLTNRIVEGSTAPRGRIYDRNGKLLVDNKPNKVISYKKNGNKTEEEINIAYQLSNILEMDININTTNLKKFWLKKYPEKANNKITEEEYNEYKFRHLTATDLENLRLERITEEEINSLSEEDRKAAMIYTLMNKGYSTNEKIIKNENVTDEEYATIASSDLSGVEVRLDWKREYLYGDTFRSILGTVTNSGGLPYELKDYYLEKGYSLDDRVGSSYLEYQYDDYLKGQKDIYQIDKLGKKHLIQEGSKGNDLYLTIDIELQRGIEQILEEEMIKAKQEKYTEYYNRSFVIVEDPNTGEILAMVGKQIVEGPDGYRFYDYTPGIVTSSVTAGSVVKGASQATGYLYGGLKVGEIRNDACIKIASTPLKCSWKYLGNLDDIKALKYSSNTYQFQTAMKVAGLNYYYNTPFQIDSEPFMKYRNTFHMFGLGEKTGIDLPFESIGQTGKRDNGGLLLDFSIGQYDTYTPLQLSQYIGSIATGYRIQPHLLKSVQSKEETIYEAKTNILNTIDIDFTYLDRIRKGFISVMEYGGTGSGYISRNYLPAGKTGTSQSFIDTDLDGKIDTETVTNTFAAYAPYDNPKVTFTVVSPDISYPNATNSQTYVNKRISNKISNLYFTLYS